MDCRNRIGLYGSYFLCMAGIGFTLPYLPLYLRQQGLSDQAIGLISAVAALAGLLQFPAGLWSDRLGSRKPFLVILLALLAASTFLLHGAHGAIWLGVLVALFAENGACRATVESLAGAEAVHLAAPGRVGAALGALRFWKPIGIIAMAVLGSVLAGRAGPGAVLLPLGVVQSLAVLFALLIHEPGGAKDRDTSAGEGLTHSRHGSAWRDRALWVFVVAMVLFHSAAAPGGVYLGLFLRQDLGAADAVLPYAFVVMMVAWMLVVWPAGGLADRLGRRPLLIVGWTALVARLGLLAVARSPGEVLGIQVLDGLSQGLFSVLAAAWVTDRFGDPRRAGTAQVLVGSCLVFGSAVGPAVAGLLVGSLGYRGLFAVLAGVGAVATLLVIFFVPETAGARREGPVSEPMGTISDLSTSP
jgi:MFS family permease